MTYKEILDLASGFLLRLKGEKLDVLEIAKPHSIEYANHLSKAISKLSPLLGNMIEFSTVEMLNEQDWQGLGDWKRQDPGFPDTIFDGSVSPKPGIEIKTWFPLATEITARFKDSILHFEQDQTNVALIAWLPEYILYGKPKIMDVWVGSGKSLAIARDLHYHNPPDYLVFEPEDTSSRTVNLQQTNTNGYKFQGSKDQLLQAARDVIEMGIRTEMPYDPSPDYQQKIKRLLGKYPYRLDTNFAKIDRIEHEGLEQFKTRVLTSVVMGHTVKEWSKLLNSDESNIMNLLEELV